MYVSYCLKICIRVYADYMPQYLISFIVSRFCILAPLRLYL